MARRPAGTGSAHARTRRGTPASVGRPAGQCLRIEVGAPGGAVTAGARSLQHPQRLGDRRPDSQRPGLLKNPPRRWPRPPKIAAKPPDREIRTHAMPQTERIHDSPLRIGDGETGARLHHDLHPAQRESARPEDMDLHRRMIDAGPMRPLRYSKPPWPPSSACQRCNRLLWAGTRSAGRGRAGMRMRGIPV